MLNDPILFDDWHVVARASDVLVGDVKSARLLGVDLVLWRNGRGIHAWQDLCRHRGAKLSLGKVRDECLVCAYHGWCYDSSGVCTLVPAHPALTSSLSAQACIFKVIVRYDYVWVCLGNPRNPLPNFAPWGDPTFRKVSAGPYRFRACATRVLENFLDAGHYPFVHATFMGPTENFEMADYGVVSSEAGLVSSDITVRRIWREGTGEVPVVYAYQVDRPLTAHYTKSYGTERFSMMDTVTPVDEGESLVWSLMAFNYQTGLTDQAWVDYQDAVTGQDVPIVESQRPVLLPLDMGQEIPVPSDRIAVAYRHWLKKLGLKFGTSGIVD